jgi:phosphate transport system substrate-binding protein
VVNLDGVKPGDLVLDGPTLANIYLGRHQDLGRPGHIAKLNPGAKLPTHGHRAWCAAPDGSGTRPTTSPTTCGRH